jgi:hypothetical protein
MSLLDRCAGGSILEPPIPLTQVQLDQAAANDLA